MAATEGHSDERGSAGAGMNDRHLRRAYASFILAFGLIVGLLAGGCGAKASRGIQDAPIGPTDNAPAHIINMPNNYPNIAFKCNGSTGIYATTRDSIPFRIEANDPSCPKAPPG